jgi:hypothetical protein
MDGCFVAGIRYWNRRRVSKATNPATAAVRATPPSKRIGPVISVAAQLKHAPVACPVVVRAELPEDERAHRHAARVGPARDLLDLEPTLLHDGKLVAAHFEWAPYPSGSAEPDIC